MTLVQSLPSLAAGDHLHSWATPTAHHAEVKCWAGGGVVFDSVPGDEYEETGNKARGLLKAIEIAETQL